MDIFTSSETVVCSPVYGVDTVITVPKALQPLDLYLFSKFNPTPGENLSNSD